MDLGAQADIKDYEAMTASDLTLDQDIDELVKPQLT
jgi:hypothetical protein